MKHDIKMRMAKCEEFFKCLTNLLGDDYEVLESCNKDFSKYLVPKGKTNEVTYYGKPELSLRISDHWNWYSNINKCSDENYIQCYSPDILEPREREEEGKSTKPRKAISVALFINGQYHIVYGEYFNKETQEWSWKENNVLSLTLYLYNIRTLEKMFEGL